MKDKKDHLLLKILLAVLLGGVIGRFCNVEVINVLNTIKHVCGQLIFFIVPLIILAFVTASICNLKTHAGKLLGYMLGFAYISSIGAAFFAMTLGYGLIETLKVKSNAAGLKEIPEILFNLQITPVMSVMSALVLSIMIGLSANYKNANGIRNAINEFKDMVLSIVLKVMIPILPYFIFCTFSVLSYEGALTGQLPVFVKVILIAIAAQFIWLGILYLVASIISKSNAFRLIKYYLPAYLTAVGTMSSAATLPVSLKSVKDSNLLDEDVADFAIPLGSTIHLCGSVLTEVLFVIVVSEVLYGHVPAISSMIQFIFLLGIFAIGAPGVPGGTVVASLGLITSVLGFDATGISLMMTIFALQDSFGTACNIVGDGALAIILQKFKKRLHKNA